jgi:hypothetical protein
MSHRAVQLWSAVKEAALHAWGQPARLLRLLETNRSFRASWYEVDSVDLSGVIRSDQWQPGPQIRKAAALWGWDKTAEGYRVIGTFTVPCLTRSTVLSDWPCAIRDITGSRRLEISVASVRLDRRNG